MSIKGRNKKRKMSRVSSIRHKNRRRRTNKKVKMRGGNYERDVTTRTTEGVPTKPLNKIVVTVPGYGTMSGTAYKRLAEEIDRDGPDAFLK